MPDYNIVIKARVDPSEIQAQLKQISKNTTLNVGTSASKTGGVKELNAELSKTEKTTKNLSSATKALSKDQMSLGQSLAHNVKAAATWAIAMTALYGTLRKVQEGVQFVYDLDNQMNNIQMITQDTDEATQKLAQTYNDLAKQLSSNTLDVAKNAEEWLRQGRTVEDTNTLIKTSMMFSKVGMLDSAQAAELLTSSINGYGLAASEAMSVVDKMSAIDVVAATSTKDLALALSQTASSAKIAGVSFDEILSYIAVVSDVTQKSAESIGNSFKTIFARIQQVKIGTLVDPESGEDLSNVDRVLKEYGISLRNAQGEFRDTGEVIDELNKKWKTLNSMQQSEIATTIAGVRQRENFLVLMQNYDKALKYQEVSLNSAGSAQEKFNIYQDSAAAATERLRAEFEALFMDIDSKFIKGLINAGTATLEFINKAGGLQTILTTILGLLIAIKGEAIIGATVKGIVSLGKVFAGTATAASTLSISLGLVTLAITAVVVAINLYNSRQQELIQNAMTAGDALKEQSDSLNAVRVQLNDIIASTETESAKRTELISLIQSINSEYDVEAARLKSINELREDAIEKIKEESKVSAESYLAQNKAAIATAENLLNKDYSRMGGGGKSAKEHLAGLKDVLDDISAQYEKTPTKIGLMGLQSAQKQYNDFLQKYEDALAVLEQRDMAERIAKGLSATPMPLGQYGMAEATDPTIRNKYVSPKPIAIETAEEKKARLEAEQKAREELLRKSIQISMNRIEAERKAVEDSLNAEIELLKKTNDERQNEIDLINVKEKLLNAQTQKIKRVYYEGQGWVWEADKQAIKEAQDNLNNLNREAVIRKKEEERDKALAKEDEKMTAYETTLLNMMKVSKDEGTRTVIGEALGLTEYKGNWYNESGQKVFKNGGLANFTGMAWMDGTASKPEITLNNQQAAGLFNYIKGMANPSVSRTTLAGATGGGQTFNFYGGLNLPNVKNTTDFVKELEKISKNR